MFKNVLKHIGEAALSIVPVAVVVLFLVLTPFVYTPQIDVAKTVSFAIACVLMAIGMWLFNSGSAQSMSKIGEYVGSSLTKKKSMALLVIVIFLLGVFITIAEPDLSVLASQIGINEWVLILVVSVGVGIFIVIGALRIIFAQSLTTWLLAFYGLLFAVACLADQFFLPLSFDSGGVTTGPITVPFILSLGVGISTAASAKKRNSDSFGLVAFASLGPILMVMILSFFLNKNDIAYPIPTVSSENPFISFMNILVLEGSKSSLVKVCISLAPILVFFIIFNFAFLKLPGKEVGKILIGMIYTLIGLVLFLTAVEWGFMPIAKILGTSLGASSSTYWILYVVGFILGIAAIFAEPAVAVLTAQVENVSEGAVSKKTVLLALAIGNGFAVLLGLVRVMNPDFKLLYVLVPGYILAFLLTFLTPKIFSAIAFDSGGVVSGPMNSTFLVPLAVGACWAFVGQNESAFQSYVFTNALGMIAIVAMMPLVTIQALGLFATVKGQVKLSYARSRVKEQNDDQIIHF